MFDARAIRLASCHDDPPPAPLALSRASGLATAVALVITLLLSMRSWRFLEKPLIGYSHRWTYATSRVGLAA